MLMPQKSFQHLWVSELIPLTTGRLNKIPRWTEESGNAGTAIYVFHLIPLKVLLKIFVTAPENVGRTLGIIL